MLFNGLEKWFCRKYAGPQRDASYFHDVSCALHLSLRGIKYLYNLTPTHADEVREIVWDHVKEMALKSFEEDRENADVMNGESHHSSYLQRGRSARNEA